MISTLLAVVVVATSLAAGPPKIDVSVAGCSESDDRRIAGLLGLELAEAPDAPDSGLRVEVACREDQVQIDVTDPLTDKRVSRTMPAPPTTDEGRARVIALAASRLVIASWMELLLEPPPEAEPSPAREQATQIVRERVEAPAPADRPLELGLAGGIDGRSLEREPIPAMLGELRFAAWFRGGVGVIAGLQYGLAEVSRQSGSVRAHRIEGGAGVGWRLDAKAPISVRAKLLLAGGYVHLRGQPDDPAKQSGVRAGATGSARLELGPQLRLDRFRLAVDGHVGYGLRTPIAEVVGEPEVSVGGLFVGAVLRIAVALGTSR